MVIYNCQPDYRPLAHGEGILLNARNIELMIMNLFNTSASHLCLFYVTIIQRFAPCVGPTLCYKPISSSSFKTCGLTKPRTTIASVLLLMITSSADNPRRSVMSSLRATRSPIACRIRVSLSVPWCVTSW